MAHGQTAIDYLGKPWLPGASALWRVQPRCRTGITPRPHAHRTRVFDTTERKVIRVRGKRRSVGDERMLLEYRERAEEKKEVEEEISKKALA